MTTIFYNTYPQPTIEHKPHNRQKLLFAAIAIGLATMVLENLFSLLFDEIKRELVSFVRRFNTVAILYYALLVAVGDLFFCIVPTLAESIATTLLEAAVII